MPFEALTCPGCGSANVQEVKPGTYFCAHCESVFRHIDPSRLTVSHAPSFCLHGNPVVCQCQLCGAGMCGACDVLQSADPYGFHREISVPAVGFGYVEWPPRHSSGTPRPDERVTGPLFYSDKLISSLTSSHGDLRHVCRPCVASAIPVTAERIITGAICESPHCSEPSKARCRCCGSGFCEGCLTPEWLTHDWFRRQGLAEHHDPYGRYRYYPGVPGYWPCLPYIGGSQMEWAAPDNLCRACVGENVERAAELSTKMCEGFPELLPGTEVKVYNFRGPDRFLGVRVAYEFRVAGEKQLSSRRRQHKEWARTSEIAQRCAAEVAGRLQKEMAEIWVSGGCARQRAFGEKKPYATYAIVDERDKTAPAAAPEATQAR